MTNEEMLELPEVQAEIERIAEMIFQSPNQFTDSPIYWIEWDGATEEQRIPAKQLARKILFGKDSKLAVILNQDLPKDIDFYGSIDRETGFREGRIQLVRDGFRRVVYVGL